MRYEYSLLVKVSEMYYFQKKAQKEIGVILDLSPATVSRVLQEALDMGVVKVEIVEKDSEYDELGKKLQEKFNLEYAKVINIPYSSDQWHQKKALGQAAKEVFLSLVAPGNNIGIGAGETLYEMISSLNVGDIAFNVKIVPMMGGWASSRLNTETNNLVYNLASVLKCEYASLLAPAVVSSGKMKELLYEEEEIKKVQQLWHSLDIAVMSIGPDITLGNHKDYYANEISSNATGDLLGWIIQEDGELMQTSLHNKLISLPIDTLKKVPKRIAIGGGKSKCRNVNAVLKGGYATHLVTDSETALYILNNG